MTSQGLLSRALGFTLVFGAGGAVVPACGGDDTSCAIGAERCACFAEQHCNAGLTCASGLCVRLGSETGGSGGAGAVPGSAGASSASGGSGAGAGSPGSGGTPAQPASCPALRIALVGRPGQSHPEDASALGDWLIQYGGATVDAVTHIAGLTPELLEQHDLLILLDLAGDAGYWSFTTEQVDAVTAWVRGGGGLMALSGFGASADEIQPTNQLLGFAGMVYEGSDVFTTYDNCTRGPMPVEGWVASHPVAANITAIGAFMGRPISISGGSATAVAAMDGQNFAVAAEVEGGRVFAFTDEWITYVSAWRPTTTADPGCEGSTAKDLFQVGQFWQNVIRWSTRCPEFNIEDLELTIVD